MNSTRTFQLLLISITLISFSLINLACGQNSEFTTTKPSRSGDAGEYDSLMVLYGDPHVHTVLSDGDESPDYAMRYARDVAKLDWCCLSDHSEMIVEDNRVAEDYYRSIPDKYTVDGEFSVLFGYEWTNRTVGHRNVYSATPDIPLVSCRDENFDTPQELWTALDGYDALTITHHPLLPCEDNWWEYTNSEIETCVEFYSKWGQSLFDGNDRQLIQTDPSNSILPAMAEGDLRYGLMAGTDTHMSRPGCLMGESRPDGTLEYDQPGITAVGATENTPEAVFYALKNRHCYGMTGTRISLEFIVNGYIMGHEITSDTPPEIEFDLSSEGTIGLVELLKIHNGEIDTIEIWTPSANQFSDNFTDDLFIENSAYLLIVTLENTDQAVSTPVWVDYTHSGQYVPTM